MIIVDKALAARERQGQPIRVGMIGAGFMGRGIARQIIKYTTGMELVAISNRSLPGAERAYREAGIERVAFASSPSSLESLINLGHAAITDDPFVICEAENLDAIIEVTGTVEFGANVVLKAIECKKHVVMMNAELDGTLGPILKHKADRTGVVITNADGDQPGVTMNLHRFVTGIGVRPVLCCNVKGLHDPYRNPTTQEAFARRWKQKPHMVASFADGTKISFEQAIIANATGLRIAQRGMLGPTVQPGTSIAEAAKLFPLEQLLEGQGIVDYVVGAEPAPGVFILGTQSDPVQQHYLELYKLGPGPFYCFYTPYHLCHFEVPNSVARAVLFGDATIAPSAGSIIDVITAAKVDLMAGDTLDGIGFYMTYGLAENADTVVKERLLPIGLAEGCKLLKDIKKDQIVTRDDVKLPQYRLSDCLRAEQDKLFHTPHWS